VSQRFISNVALAIAGAVVVVASQAFSSSVTGWAMFGVSLGALALLAVVERGAMNDRAQRSLDAVIGLLAVWSAVASVVYSGRLLTWLSLSEGLAFVALAVIGLAVHEIRTERVVHALEAVPATRRQEGQTDELQAAA
jgi:CDP-diglyceride synthetase